MIQSLAGEVAGSACEQFMKQAKDCSVVERVCHKSNKVPSYLIGITNAKLSGSFLEPQSSPPSAYGRVLDLSHSTC